MDVKNSVLLQLGLPHWVGALRDLRYSEREPPGVQHSVQMAAGAGQSEAVGQRQ